MDKKSYKYPQLNDKEWLYQKYIVEKISAREISRIVGAKSSQTVEQALERSTIKIERIRPPRVVGKSFYEKLNDYEWMYQTYVIEGKSTIDIAKLSGAKSCATVKQSLERLKIPIRSLTEGHLCKRDINYKFNIDRQVIDGCLLGDAFLSISKGATTKDYPKFGKNNIYYDHQKCVGEILFGKNWRDRVREYPNKRFEQYHCKNIFSMRGLVDKNLSPFYDRWYPEWNEYKKVIPEDIEIDGTLLLHWFLDDGYSYVVNRKYKNPKYNKRKIRIEFATQSFLQEELEMFSKKIYNKLGLIIKPRFHQRNGEVAGTGFEMCLAETKDQVSLFYDIIGPCPVPSMQYKWK